MDCLVTVAYCIDQQEIDLMLVKIESLLQLVKKVEVLNHEEVDFDASPNYGEIDYWNDRYQKEEGGTFDWLGSWSEIKDLVFKHTIKQDESANIKVLNLGCGNSILCEDMYDDGIQNIYNMDISDIVINKMKNRNAQKRPAMDW